MIRSVTNYLPNNTSEYLLSFSRRGEIMKRDLGNFLMHHAKVI